MSRIRRRSCAFVLGASLTLGAVAAPCVLSGAADADDAATVTSATTSAAVLAALQAAHDPTAAANAGDWSSHAAYADRDGSPEDNGQEDIAFAASEKRALFSETGTTARTIAVDHRGMYQSVAAFAEYQGVSTGRVVRGLAMVGRSDRTWVFEPDSSVDLEDPDSGTFLMRPAALIEFLSDPTVTAIDGTPTEAVAGDGSTTYGFAATMTIPDDDDSGNSYQVGYVTVTIDPGNVVTGFSEDFGEGQEAATYSYGTQHVALPTSDEVVRESLAEEGVRLMTLASATKGVARTVQILAGPPPRRHAALVRSVRSAGAYEVRSENGEFHARVFRARPTADGVRITGVNPFTQQKFAYTVEVAGRKVTVHRVAT
jgi:hypothetical protein